MAQYIFRISWYSEKRRVVHFEVGSVCEFVFLSISYVGGGVLEMEFSQGQGSLPEKSELLACDFH